MTSLLRPRNKTAERPEPAGELVGAVPGSRIAFVALLACLATLGQLPVNLLLPALPGMAAELGSPSLLSLVVSLFLAGFAAGQLVFGPLSDRFGRRPTLLTGLLLFTLAGVIAAATSSVSTMLVARVGQGIGASAAVVIGRAIARDCFAGPALARVLGAVTAAMSIVPGLAPVLGGILEETVGWRASLWLASGCGGAFAAVVLVYLPETNLSVSPGYPVANLGRSYWTVIRNNEFLRHALITALALAPLYAFFAGGPALFISQLGLTPIAFGFLGVANALAYALGGLAAMSLGGGRRGKHVAVFGLVLIVLGTGSLIAPRLSALGTLEQYLLGLAVYSAGLGMVLPFGVAGALTPFGREAGAASGLLGALQIGAGGAAAALMTSSGTGPAVVFPTVMFALAVGAASIHVAALLRERISRIFIVQAPVPSGPCPPAAP